MKLHTSEKKDKLASSGRAQKPIRKNKLRSAHPPTSRKLTTTSTWSGLAVK
jgi:hypothetical protein